MAEHTLIELLEECAKELDWDADRLDDWAQQSISGGWSTHQVQANRQAADDCRRRAAAIRRATAKAST